MEKDRKYYERLLAYERFCDKMAEKKMTSYRLSQLTGIATSTLSDWKNGKSIPKQDKMTKIAEVLETTVDYIVNGTIIELSPEDAMLDVQISSDPELKKAIKKFYSLDDRKKKHIIELIDLLSEE